MGRNVKLADGAGRPPVTKSRVSSKHQVTIARAAFDAAGLHEGDVVAIRALGPGRLELTRLDALFERHRGRLSGGPERRAQIEAARDAWA